MKHFHKQQMELLQGREKETSAYEHIFIFNFPYLSMKSDR